MPVKRLPPRPNLDHLKGQAGDLIANCRRRDARACQRLREFHPRYRDVTDARIGEASLTWSDGLVAIAREYGFASWARLRAHVLAGRDTGDMPLIDRIEDPLFRHALEMIDDGDVETLRALLAAHPDLASRRVAFEGQNYFRAPALLAFVAENPVRNDSLPANIVEVARLLLESGTGNADIDDTLGLVASGRVAREAGVQCALIELLVEAGADPGGAMLAALGHGEFEAARCLRASGASESLAFAAAMGDVAMAQCLLPQAGATERHQALALAAQHGQAGVLRLLLEAGVDPNRFNPPTLHGHSTPLHQAAYHGHEGAVHALMAHGARTDIADTLWNEVPSGWARHAGQEHIVALLEAESR